MFVHLVVGKSPIYAVELKKDSVQFMTEVVLSNVVI